MSVRDPGSLSSANGAYLVVDHFVRGWRLINKKKQGEGEARNLLGRRVGRHVGEAHHVREQDAHVLVKLPPHAPSLDRCVSVCITN